MTPTDLPDIHIQETVGEVLNDVKNGSILQEDFWVEIDGTHHTVTVRKTDKGISFSSLDVEVSQTDSELRFDNKFTFLLGGMLHAPFSPQTCGDVDPITNRVVAGDGNGSLAIYDPDTCSSVIFDGHVLHTSVARFFPSREVILSAGMDFALKIWDARTGRLAQTLKHQRGMVSSVEMIGRGRNILSMCQVDSTVALWECGGAQVTYEWHVPGVQDITLAGHPNGKPDGAGEFGVAGLSMILGTTDSLDVYDLRTRQRSLSVNSPAIHSVSCTENDVAAALSDAVRVYDLRMMNREKLEMRASASQVLFTDKSLIMRTPSGILRCLNGPVDKLCGESQYVTCQNDILYSFGRTVRAYVHI